MALATQQLMDLPYAGMAEKQLRKDGRWQLTPMECLQNIPDDHCTNDANVLIENAIRQLEDYTCN